MAREKTSLSVDRDLLTRCEIIARSRGIRQISDLVERALLDYERAYGTGPPTMEQRLTPGLLEWFLSPISGDAEATVRMAVGGAIGGEHQSVVSQQISEYFSTRRTKVG